jgi:hypothetical protein
VGTGAAAGGGGREAAAGVGAVPAEAATGTARTAIAAPSAIVNSERRTSPA